MVHEFEFRFDVPFVKNALRRDFLWRGYLMGGTFFVVMMGVMRLWFGHFDPMISTTCILGSLAIAVSFHYKLGKYARRVCEIWSKQSPSGIIRYELDEEGLTVRFDHAHSRFEWTGLRKLWCYSDVWLLEIVKMQSVFFPPEQVACEAKDYIRERCRAAGVSEKGPKSD